MSKPSHIPLFPDAYLRDNYRLTLEQHGLFLVLMMEAWGSEDCTLPDDEKQLAEIAGLAVAKFRKIAPAVLARWTREGGRLHQKRLLKEWHYVREKSAKRKAAADAKWEKQRGFADANAMQMDSKCNASAMHLGGGEGEGGGGGSKGVIGVGSEEEVIF
jgi:uncharacterized protein YdaU (DUF1376 family)